MNNINTNNKNNKIICILYKKINEIAETTRKTQQKNT